MSLEGRVALITGGAQGIGKAIARRLLEAGMGVTLADLDAEAGEAAEAELGDLGNVCFAHTDVRDEDAAAISVAGTLAHFGRLDALVNNAGINLRTPVTELDLDDWRRVLDTNLTGAFLCAKHAAPYLKQARGAIVNIASTRALMSEPDTEAYAASKGGLVALTHALAVSLGPEVRVNCISPGWIDVSGWTKAGAAAQEALTLDDHAQHPVGRVGRPEDVAGLVAWLLGAEAGFVTGANIPADGGMMRKMIYL